MKAKDIQVGSHYKAKVSGNIVTVRVDNIATRTAYGDRDGYSGRRKLIEKAAYEVTNLVTGKKLVFRSAQRFRGPATYMVPEARQTRPAKQRLEQVITKLLDTATPVAKLAKQPQPITDACPNCNKQYKWDARQDTYVGTDDIDVVVTDCGKLGTDISLHRCKCGAIVGITVTDDNGSTVYVPSTKER